MLHRIFWSFPLLLALVVPLQAAVDLVTLPTREGTQLTITLTGLYMIEDYRHLREKPLRVCSGFSCWPSSVSLADWALRLWSTKTKERTFPRIPNGRHRRCPS